MLFRVTRSLIMNIIISTRITTRINMVHTSASLAYDRTGPRAAPMSTWAYGAVYINQTHSGPSGCEIFEHFLAHGDLTIGCLIGIIIGISNVYCITFIQMHGRHALRSEWPFIIIIKCMAVFE